MFLSSSNVRKQKVQEYGEGYLKLKKAFDAVPAEASHYRRHHDEWTINEIITHAADSEAVAYVNLRCAVAEPTETIFSFDKDLWAESLSYYAEDCTPVLKLFHVLRTSNYMLLKNIEEYVWLQTVNYAGHGQITLEDLIDLYEKHLNKIITEIGRNTEAWKTSKH